MRNDRHGAIGVFDSGVGGLTVLKALIDRLPRESTIYLGDTARVPYGTKSEDVVTRYSLANARELSAHGIKMLVVACNTASAMALPALSSLPIPVVGVIDPGARAAAEQTRVGKIAVIGTPGTISSGAYQRALAAQNPRIETHVGACPLFVPLAEEGWTEGEIALLVARRYLTPELLLGVDTLLLGCTHYPLLSQVLREVVGPDVALVDSAAATADAVVELLHNANLAAEPTSAPSHRFLVTDTPDRFLSVGSRFLGRKISEAIQVDLKMS